MDILSVDPNQMKINSGIFESIYLKASEIESYLYHAMGELGDFMGDDRTGRAFKELFVPAVSSLLEGMRGIGHGMHLTGVKIFDSANMYEEATRVNSGLVR